MNENNHEKRNLTEFESQLGSPSFSFSMNQPKLFTFRSQDQMSILEPIHPNAQYQSQTVPPTPEKQANSQNSSTFETAPSMTPSTPVTMTNNTSHIHISAKLEEVQRERSLSNASTPTKSKNVFLKLQGSVKKAEFSGTTISELRDLFFRCWWHGL